MGWFDGTLSAQTASPTIGSPGQPQLHQAGRSVAGVIARYLPFGSFEWAVQASTRVLVKPWNGATRTETASVPFDETRMPLGMVSSTTLPFLTFRQKVGQRAPQIKCLLQGRPPLRFPRGLPKALHAPAAERSLSW